MRLLSLRLAAIAAGLSPLTTIFPALGLPPPEDTPEEILRTEIIVDARSPLDGKPLSAAEYAELQAQLQNENDWDTVPPSVANLIFLLEVRRVLKPIIPIFP